MIASIGHRLPVVRQLESRVADLLGSIVGWLDWWVADLLGSIVGWLESVDLLSSIVGLLESWRSVCQRPVVIWAEVPEEFPLITSLSSAVVASVRLLPRVRVMVMGAVSVSHPIVGVEPLRVVGTSFNMLHESRIFQVNKCHTRHARASSGPQ